MAKEPGVFLSSFFEHISPGGKYYKYALGVLIALGTVLLTVALAIGVPLLTGKFQNPLSEIFQSRINPPPSPLPETNVLPCREGVLPEGQQVYEFSYGKNVQGPKIGTLTFDSLTPNPREKLILTISVKNDTPLTGVTAQVYTDQYQIPLKFKLIDGNDTDGTWQAAATFMGTVQCQYYVQFDIKSPSGNNNGTVYIK